MIGEADDGAIAISTAEEAVLAILGAVRGRRRPCGIGITARRVDRSAAAIAMCRGAVGAAPVTTVIGDPDRARPQPLILPDPAHGAQVHNGLAGLLSLSPVQGVALSLGAGAQARGGKELENDRGPYVVTVLAVTRSSIRVGGAQGLDPRGPDQSHGLLPDPEAGHGL